MNLRPGHYCYYILESNYDPERGYRPVVVIEDEPGYRQQGGDGPDDPAPWYWGHDLEQAEAICRQRNERLGVSPEDADRIVASSMRAKPQGVGGQS